MIAAARRNVLSAPCRISPSRNRPRKRCDAPMTSSRRESNRELTTEVKQNLAPMVASKGLKFTAGIGAGLPVIHTDRLRLLQVLLNLASNAVKFTASGEVDIGCETIADNQLRISVTDTGAGIQRERMQLLFQPFSQVDGGLGRRHDGTGLGLYLAQRLAKLLGGEITAESEFGSGSKFTLDLPFVNP